MTRSVMSIRKRFGVAASFKFVAYRLFQRLLVLDITQLMLLDSRRLNVPSTPDSDFDFRCLAADELRAFAGDASNDLDSLLLPRLETTGDCCFAAVVGDVLAGYVWFAFRAVPPECSHGGNLLTGVGIRYPDDIVFMYKGFVHPRYRGRQLYGQIMVHAGGYAWGSRGHEDSFDGGLDELCCPQELSFARQRILGKHLAPWIPMENDHHCPISGKVIGNFFYQLGGHFSCTYSAQDGSSRRSINDLCWRFYYPAREGKDSMSRISSCT